jgi:hypothetical protein
MRNLMEFYRGMSLPALLGAASLGVLIVATTSAEARVGVGRPGVGVGRVGSGLGVRPGVGVGRAGLGVRGWRGRVGYGYGRYGYGRYRYRGYGYGYGAAALTGAALGYGAGPYYGSGFTGLYSFAPSYRGVAAGAAAGGGYALIQFDGGHCEVWSDGYPSGSGWTALVGGLPNWDAGEAAYHYARAQGACH